MSATSFTYRVGAERPTLTLPWQEETSPGTFTDLDLSTGYTFSLTLTRNGSTALTKTTGITGQNGSVLVAWAVGELEIAAGSYELNLRATAGGLDRDYRPSNPLRIVIVD